ncbi:MAG: redoxin family protein [Vicinamibacteria bacterium]
MNRGVLGLGLLVTTPLLAILILNRDRRPLDIRTPLIQKPAPDVFVKSLDGEGSLRLSSLKGKPVVVNFWASWCVPCVEEHAALSAFAQANPDVAFVGIVYEDTAENARAFLSQRGRAYTPYIDDSGKASIAFGVYGVPETFFVNAAGTIVAKTVGAVNEQSLEENLAEARK